MSSILSLAPVRNQMYETEQILTGITETHTTADSGFVIGSGTGHVESNHTLILVPGVDHTVDFLVSGIYRVACQQLFPVKPVMLQKASSTCASVWYFASISLARVLLITP